MFQQYCCVFIHEFANTKNEHIVSKFTDIHILRDNILDFVWAVFVLKNHKRLVFWPSARAIFWVFLAPTRFTIVSYAILTVHAQFLPTLLGEKHSHCELPFFPTSSTTQETAQ